MAISRAQIPEQIDAYKEGGDVLGSDDRRQPSASDIAMLNALAQATRGANYEANLEKYQQRLGAMAPAPKRMDFFQLASELGAGLLSTPNVGGASAFTGLGVGFTRASDYLKKIQEDTDKRNEQIKMQAMQLAMQDEQKANDFMTEMAIKAIDNANKDVDYITLQWQEPDADGVMQVKTQRFADTSNNQGAINELVEKYNATEIKPITAQTMIQTGGGDIEKEYTKRILDDADLYQEKSSAASAVVDQINTAYLLAQQVGPENFGPFESATLTMRSMLDGLGFDTYIDDEKIGPQKALNQLSMSFTMAIVSQTKGAISNREMQLFIDASPGLGSTYEGYLEQLKLLERFSRRDRDFYFDYLEKMDEIEDRQPPVSEQKKYTELEKYAEEWRDDPKNSLFTPEETEMLENIVKTRQGLADDFVPKDFQKLFNEKKEEIAKKAKIESAISSQSNQDELIKMRDEIASKLNNNEYPEDQIEERKKQLRQLNAALASG